MQPPTVFIVDDDPAFCESLDLLIRSFGMATATFASGDEYLQQFDPSQPGCVILDVRMPGRSGLDLQEELSKFDIHPPVIIMTAFAEVPAALRAMRQGAVEFLQKTFSESELLDAITRALAVDADNRRQHGRRQELNAMMGRLSAPEQAVLDLMLQGAPNKAIAASLGVSVRTVEDRRARIMRKLKVDTVAELVRLAVEAGRISVN
ncbi:MAG: DNA-binding response regulator [Planctomycetota bacterium]|nr:MAG: DNA-binding response regulator [Planctomycetota bacterium]